MRSISATDAICLTVAVVVFAFATHVTRAREAAQDLRDCRTNLRSIATANEMYATDNSGRYPTTLACLVPRYLERLPTCPAAHRDTYSASFASASDPDWYTVFCEGHNHEAAGWPPDTPAFRPLCGMVERVGCEGLDGEVDY